ncbi:Rab-like protein [Schistosoma japonicum]|nr:Rab-like protein [Schistosoma japonicum]
MYVYKFLNIPFLCLQRDVLHYQLKRNYNEMISILSELNPKVGNETPKQHYTDPDETKSTNDLPPICSSSSSPFVIEGSGKLEQIPVVLAFSEEIDPADNEIYYLNNNNNLESPTRSYTFAPSSNNDDSDICGVDGDNLYLTNKNSPHEIIMDELQSDLRLGQSNLSYPHHFNRSKLKVDSTIENSGQSYLS